MKQAFDRYVGKANGARPSKVNSSSGILTN